MNRIGGVGKSPGGSPGRNKRQQNQRRQPQQQPQVNVNEWETRWDEDSDEEDDDVKPGMLSQQQQQQQQQLPMGGANALPTTAIPSQPLGPPELDSGFSGAASAAAAPVVSPELQAQQQQQQATTTTPIFPPTNPAGATPGPLGASQPPSKPEATVTDDENDDDGVEWDTGAASDAVLPADGELDDTSTPNVKQFLPLLRVLGKGSFGKVGRVSCDLVFAQFSIS